MQFVHYSVILLCVEASLMHFIMCEASGEKYNNSAFQSRELRKMKERESRYGLTSKCFVRIDYEAIRKISFKFEPNLSKLLTSISFGESE